MAGSPTAEAEIHQPACTKSESEPFFHADSQFAEGRSQPVPLCARRRSFGVGARRAASASRCPPLFRQPECSCLGLSAPRSGAASAPPARHSAFVLSSSPTTPVLDDPRNQLGPNPAVRSRNAQLVYLTAARQKPRTSSAVFSHVIFGCHPRTCSARIALPTAIGVSFGRWRSGSISTRTSV